jgi:hypothetical protein
MLGRLELPSDLLAQPAFPLSYSTHRVSIIAITFCDRRGTWETRTPDLPLAKQVLFRLSYSPRLLATNTPSRGGTGETRTPDILLAKQALFTSELQSDNSGYYN